MLAGGASGSGAATLRIPADYPTIQAGIAAAQDGDTVLVSPGTYPECIDFLKKGITVASSDGPEVTIIDAQNKGIVVNFNYCQKPCILRGFTLRNGYDNFGTAIYMYFSSPRIIGNIIDGNTNWTSSAVFVISSSPIIEKNTFRKFSCVDSPTSAVVCAFNGSEPKVINNLFLNNPCRAINIGSEGDAEASNNTIIGNKGGISVYNGSIVASNVYRNNIIFGNDSGFEVQFAALSVYPGWRNNLVYNNKVDFEGVSDQTGLNGNISADPLFFDPGNNDYHLGCGSPAVDAGDSSSLSPSDTDFEGNPRLVDGSGSEVAIVDIGAYEFDPDVPLQVTFKAEKISGNSPLFIGFTGTANKSIAEYLWDFGDGTSSTETNPIHSFNPGTYTVSLNVSAPSGTAAHTVTLNVFRGGMFNTDAATIRVPDVYPSIQAGIAAAKDGGTVLVGAGTYAENIDFLNKAIDVISAKGPAVTVIEGSNKGYAVTIENDYSRPSVPQSLQGFTIRNGNGGVSLQAASPTIRGNVFESNVGSAIYGLSSSPLIEQNIFRNNACDDEYSTEGIVLLSSSDPSLIVDNLFYNNSCCAIGIGCFSNQLQQVMNNTIVGNRCGIGINGVCSDDVYPGSGIVANNIIVGNKVGLQTMSTELGSTAWQNNLVYGNNLDYHWVTDQTGINGNISADPCFIDDDKNNYHLSATSPAIDSGSASSASLSAMDFDGNPRTYGSKVDIGAYEFNQAQPSALTSVDYFGIEEGNRLVFRVRYADGSTDSKTKEVDVDSEGLYLMAQESSGGSKLQNWLQVTSKSLLMHKRKQNGSTVSFNTPLVTLQTPLIANGGWGTSCKASKNGVRIRAMLTAKVSPQVLVSVPAGHFMAWPIAYALTSSPEYSTLSSTWTEWFVPYIGTVKSKDSKSTSTLTSFSMGRGAVTYPPPVVAGTIPASATAGTAIKIKGYQLGASQGTSVVKIGGADCEDVLSWSDTEIECTVPAAASSGVVTVVMDTWTSNDNIKLKILPKITTVTPAAGKRKSAMEISGVHFGAFAGSVKFGTVPGKIIKWSNNSITCKVPGALLHRTYPVTVVNSKGQNVLRKAFTVVE